MHRSKETKLSEVMSSRLVVAAPHYSIIDCINLMLENNIQHLPVGQWGHLSPGEARVGESDDEVLEKSAPAFDYEARQPQGLLTAYDIIRFLAKQSQFLDLAPA